MEMELSNEEGLPRVTLGLSRLRPRTCLPRVLSSLWSCDKAYQGRALDFVDL